MSVVPSRPRAALLRLLLTFSNTKPERVML